MLRRAWLAGVVAVFMGLTGCADDEPTLEGTAPPQATAPAEGPSLSISEPTEALSVEPGGVKVAVTVEEFEIVDKLSEPAVEGEGHVHFYFDVDEGDLPTEAGKPAITADAKTYHATADTSYTWADVEAGEHTFCVQLVNNNHTPLEPAVTDCVTVTVE
jgi:hypothetical protein